MNPRAATLTRLIAVRLAWYIGVGGIALMSLFLHTQFGVDVLLSNHTDYDGSKLKLPALAARAPGAPHPYVVGADSVGRYLTVAEECALAALAAVQP